MLKRILFSLLIILLFVTPVSGVGYLGNGVDDLRGVGMSTFLLVMKEGNISKFDG